MPPRKGLAISLLAFLFPLYWIVPLFGQYDPVSVTSLYLGCVSLIAMGLVQLMATRLPVLEELFGSLDRQYLLHKWLGICAVLAFLLHDMLEPEFAGLGPETGLSDFGAELGEIAYYGLCGLVLASLLMLIPYHIWRWSHKFTGLLFALSALHFVLVLKPVDLSDPLSLYVLFFCVVGILSYLYTLLPWHLFRQGFDYRISSLERAGGALSVWLEPLGNKLSGRPGQFAFVRFDGSVPTGPHPFSFSSAPDEGGRIRFTIRNLGDDTALMHRVLKEGDRARISPAFGRFQTDRKSCREIWIAAGVGVTPFLAMARAYRGEKKVDLFHTVRDGKDAIHFDELKAVAARYPDFSVHLVESRGGERLSVSQIIRETHVNIRQLSVLFCGPSAMRREFQRDFVKSGLPGRRFRYDHFELRSDIGLSKTVRWLLSGCARVVRNLSGARGRSTG
ncbi:ferredoxin reductase family protein [Kiloniella sp. b19]|uniref:ferredoxin reductase family protein n=1 Tax=Kiloniella sp. GXU_MW_B19 TaxID=3141326 RepID=UPI0031D43C71